MRSKVNNGNDVNEKQLREICSTYCHITMSELVEVDDTTVKRRQSSGLSLYVVSLPYMFEFYIPDWEYLRYLLIYHPFEPFM